MTDQNRRERGREIRRELYGEAATNQLDAEVYTDPVMDGFAELTQEFVFGTLWDRPGIDLSTRCLVTVVSDVATGQHEALGIHLRFALRHGWTQEQLTEVIVHLLGYLGVPPVRRALLVAKATFAQIAAEDVAV